MKARTFLNVAVLLIAFAAFQTSQAAPPPKDTGPVIHSITPDLITVCTPSPATKPMLAIMPETAFVPDMVSNAGEIEKTQYSNSKRLQKLKYRRHGRDKI